ncbi:MAG: DUF4279 domain-containing protein [Clostridiales bacterium]|nr:DUF4279 domain-containing protein [Clostridiales bacterium]
MHLIFDNDFDVYSISQRLGIEATDCKIRKETQISPLTNKHIEGFWTLKTEEKKETDLKIVLNDLMSKIVCRLSEIKKICDENEGTVVFDIVPFFNSNHKPALYFEKEFLDVVHYLNAEIQIDMYVE